MQAKITIPSICAAVLAATMAFPVMAYDGTNCEAPGNCWQPKPGFPEQIEGTKYDPHHDPAELAKQQEALQRLEARNAQCSQTFMKTGEWPEECSS